MKSRLLSVCLLAALSIVGTQSFARELRVAGRPAPSQASYKTEANDCNVPTSQFSMDVNNIRTTLLDAGDSWFNISTSTGAYEAPKGDRTSGRAYAQALFAGAIWVSGIDAGNNLKIAALTYRANGTDYYSGPLDNSGGVSLATCNLWDQHFPVWATQIKPLVTAYQAALIAGGTPGSITLDVTAISDSVKYWPAKGNALLAAKGYDMSGILAPFYDADGDGIYNPAKGDYPTIKHGGINTAVYGNDYCFDTSAFSKNTAYADQMIFWVTNDKGNVHNGTSSGVPIGIQVNNLGFAFQTSDEINNMTFYTYNIFNKSGAVLNKTYMSQYVDPDLGCASNDAVGCDTSRSLGFVYNSVPAGASNTPGYNYLWDKTGATYCNNGAIGYDADLPMIGIDFFEGPIETSPDPAHPNQFIHKQLGLTAFESYTNADNAYGDPSTSVQFRNYQTGLWRDGSPVTYGGEGHGASALPISFMYPGDPSIATQWSECNSQVPSINNGKVSAGDRRFVQTSGPFTFQPCGSQNITVGVVFVQPTGGVGTNCPSFSMLGTADDKAQALFDAKFNAITGPSAPLLSIRELSQKVIINIEDDPAGNNIGESYKVADVLRVRKGYVPGSGLDSLYKFQGYIIYQLSDEQVSVNNLTDPSKAVPIAVYDIADNVSHLVNWNTYLDHTTNATNYEHDVNTIPGVGLDLPNKGIKHSLIDSIDLIGGGQMVNHQTYYFGVLAFATNNFKTFDPNTGIGQSAPFLIGGFGSYNAIPSDPASENGGRVLNTYWGASSQVKRMEGQGNGGNYIDLTPETVQRILASPLNYTDTLDYTVGFDPIGLKVTDPVLLKEADFELKIHDTLYNGVNVSTSAYWILKDLTNNVEIPSVRSLDAPYEQIISTAAGEDYGFSITLGTPFPIYTNPNTNMPIYGPIGGSISFADTTQPWLSFVADSGEGPKNWIRSGQTFINCTVQAGITPDPACNVFSDAYYLTGTGTTAVPHFTDPNSAFDHIAGGKWAPYCLGANWSMSNVGGNQVNVGARPQTVGGPSFKWDKYNDMASSPRNNLEKLQSVDIVLTSDKSLWSKCVVFETGENPDGADLDPNLTGKAPRKGMLRGHYSLNLDGTYSSDQTGQSYFPGYAINIETGQRLEVAFGEASDERDQNGRDMIWNPTSTVLGSLNNGNAAVPYAPIFAGRHYLYVLDYPYPTAASGIQPGDSIHNILTDPLIYGSMVNNPVTQPYSASVIGIYDHIMWTAMPYVTPGFSLKSFADGLIPTDVTIKLRVQKPYAKFGTNVTPFTTEQDSLPRYVFSTKGKGVTNNNDSVAKTALDMIRIVPNPYYAFSSYEISANDSRVKITNLPNNCSIKIFTLDGVLVRTLNRAIGIDPRHAPKLTELSDGKSLVSGQDSDPNQDNSLDWDLKNEKNISVASGIYLFDINVPGVGHKTLKWFGAMRPTDVSNF